MLLNHFGSGRFFRKLAVLPVLLGVVINQAAGEEARMEIIAYCTPTEAHMTVTRFEEMIEAGFTAGIPAERNHDLESMSAMLDLAAEAGIKLFVTCRELLEDPEGVAAHFKDHPAVAGYFVIDEPTWAEDGWQKTAYVANPVTGLDLSDIVERIQAVDPDRPCYINLFPNVASAEQLGTPTYHEHVSRFLEEVPEVAFVSFDHYPIANYALRDAWFENLEIVSTLARAHDKPFWAFALSSTHYAYTPPTLAHIRLQHYVNLAYGAQGLQYFPYWAPNANHWFAPIEYDGGRSYLWEHVRELNAAIQLRAPVFKDATVLSVGHTGTAQQWRPGLQDDPEPWDVESLPLPPGGSAYVPEPPVESLIAQGQHGAVVSLLEKEDVHYLAVVNKDYAHMMVLRMHFDGSRDIAVMTPDGAWEPLTNDYFRVLVDPGDMLLLRWEP